MYYSQGDTQGDEERLVVDPIHSYIKLPAVLYGLDFDE